MSIEILNLAGLVLSFVGSFILAASMLGLEGIVRLRKNLNTRAPRAFLKRYQTPGRVWPGRTPPTASHFIRDVLMAPIITIFMLVPFLLYAGVAYLLLHYTTLNIFLTLIISYVVIWFVFFISDLHGEVYWWRARRKNSRDFASLAIGRCVTESFIWPFIVAVLLLLLLFFAVEYVFAVMFQLWVPFAEKIKGLSPDRLIGILGVVTLGLGFVLQALSLMLG